MTAWNKKILILPPLIIAVAIVIFAYFLKKPIEKVAYFEKPVKVRIITMSKMTVQPKAFAYGTSIPGKTWDAIAEVSGKIAWKSEQLEDGNIVKAGTELLRIDDTSYRLTLEQINAQIKASEIKEKTIKSSIAIDELNLKLLNKDLNNKYGLSKRGAIAKSAVDDAQLQVYSAEAKVQNLQNAAAINRADRDVLKAQKALAEYELSNTQIQAPFDVRVTEVKSHVAHFVNKGQILFSADDIQTAEINAQLTIGTLRPLMAEINETKELETHQRVPGALSLEAIVRLKTATHTIEWEGIVDRVAGLVDLQTQSIGIIVTVHDPYKQAKPGQRPPLTRNTFVEVELRGKPQPDQLVVPANAIHESTISTNIATSVSTGIPASSAQKNNVYVIDNDNRLVIRPVKIKFSQSGYTVISQGVKAGERIVISDLVPALEGMLLDPKEDKKTKKWLNVQATGTRPEK